MNYLFWIILNIFASISAVYLIKGYVLTKKYVYIILAMTSYVLLLISYINMLKFSEVSSLYSLIHVLQLIVAVMIGILLFRESISLNKIIGVGLGILSMYFLSKTI